MFRYCKSDKFTNNSFLRVQKNPRNTRFLGYLTFGHKLSCDNKSIFRLYYSMIVATRPDPTVRPPSRYQTGVLRCANGDFSCDLCGKIRIFHCVRVVFGDFVIMVLSFKNSILIFYLLASQFSHLQNPCFSIIIIKFLFTFF